MELLHSRNQGANTRTDGRPRIFLDCARTASTRLHGGPLRDDRTSKYPNQQYAIFSSLYRRKRSRQERLRSPFERTFLAGIRVGLQHLSAATCGDEKSSDSPLRKGGTLLRISLGSRRGIAMKWAFISAGILLGVVTLVAIVGLLVPRTHSATRTARFHQPPEAVWAAITDWEKFPHWRSNVSRVQSMPSRNGLPAHREWDKRGHSLPMETVELSPPWHCVGRIADPNLPFGGTWTMQISQTSDGTVLRITEDGEIRNPVFRFLARFVWGYTSIIETYLKDLGKKFGEKAQPLALEDSH